jgi:hypoxanthine phosphoribosyltransferase
MNDLKPRVLLEEKVIATRVKELAAEISADHADCDELIMVGVLKGAFIFLADLARELSIPRSIDFMSVSSYTGNVSGNVRLMMDIRRDIEGKHVVLVEDIADTGRTLVYLMELLKTRRPASIRSCALVRKLDRMEHDIHIDYLGFDIPDVWVVGYGLDYDEQLRTLPYIGEIDPPA